MTQHTLQLSQLGKWASCAARLEMLAFMSGNNGDRCRSSPPPFTRNSGNAIPSCTASASRTVMGSRTHLLWGLVHCQHPFLDVEARMPRPLHDFDHALNAQP